MVMSFAPLSPDLQISFYSRLRTVRSLYLHDALRSTLEAADLDLGLVDAELREFADRSTLRRLAAHGIRGEVFFPVPYLLGRNPFLLGYYRLLLGFSQKAFYGKGPFGKFGGMEETGKVRAGIESALPTLCASLAVSVSALVLEIDPIHQGIVHELQLLTLGPQFRGGNNNDIGRKAMERLRGLLVGMIAPYKPVMAGHSMAFQNDSGLTCHVRFASDPDVTFTQELGGQKRHLLAIELKGGKDISNVWNRLGEAEKSHLSALKVAFNERWTVLNVDVVSGLETLSTAKEKSSSTTRRRG